ncbi:non-ribosomal peptide synthetase [Amycolatopsis aidingensis]|uniref:non-ribosomal peptide synthetase n=1 Tax=Amycolatopsis aidingensis TaxID=2842453 RepID=UPI001C0B40AE|nr:non-ribosomal peptide synthetase [Amycolatopsis aidingensis]
MTAVPALPLQRGMIAAGLADPAAGTDVIQCVLHFPRGTDTAAYIAAWRAAVERHPVLRTRFRWEPDGGARQWAGPAADVPMLSGPSDVDLADFLAEDRRAGVDPVGGSALRVTTLSTVSGPVVVATFHHAILDGRSLAMLLAEIDDHCAGEVDFPPRPDFHDYVRWYTERSSDPATEDERRFWAGELAGAPPAGPLPLESPGAATPWMRVAETELSTAETAALRGLAEDAGVTVNTAVLAAWGLLLATHSGEDGAVFGVTRSARYGSVPGADEMVGLLLATTPLHLPVPRDATVADWLRTVRARSVACRDHQLCPQPAIAAAAGRGGDTPLFRSLVLFERKELDTILADRPGNPFPGRRVRILRSPGYPLTLYAFAEPKLSLRLIHDTTRFPDWAPDLLLGQVREILTGFAEHHGRLVRELLEPRGAERVRMLEKWNDTTVDYPAGASVPDLFAERVRHAPRADAVFDGSRWISYAELDGRSDRVARALRARGVRADQPVGLALPRGADLVTAMLGVLKAGAAYLPLDPANPAAREAVTLRESGTGLVIGDRLVHGVHTVPLADLLSEADSGETVLPARPHPLSVAYLNYTSGSTGRPKGVAVPHRGVVRLVSGPNFARFGPGQTFLHLSATAFDLTTLEVWGALLTGGRVVPAPEGPLDPAALAALLREHQVSVLWLTAGLFHQLVAHDPGMLAGVEQLLAGGDVLAPGAVNTALRVRGKPVINGYGPTENTTFTACHPVREPVGATVPIGRPVQRSSVFVLDERMRPVPAGVTGELYTGGDGLARGYWGQPALTAARFVPDPFGPPGSRLYRTGDLARWRPDGVLEFAGRADQQVKIRGFLVEPAEVEAVLRAHPTVADAAVLVDGAGEGRHLVACVVPAAGFDPAAMREYLATRLPPYLCPARYPTLAELPLNRSGKIDRTALLAAAAPAAGTGTGPATPTQQRLAAIWATLLPGGEFGTDDDFFTSGGNSLLAVRLGFRINEEFDVDLPIAEVHRRRTLAALAEAVDARTTGAGRTAPRPGITRRDRSAFRVPAARPATSTPEHLVVPGGGDWGAWRWIELRGTGFGVEPLLAIAAPEAARSAEALLAAEDAVGETRWAAFHALRAEEDRAEGEQRSLLRRMSRLIRKGRFAEVRAAVDGAVRGEALAALDAALAAGRTREAAAARYAADYDTARTRSAAVLREISGDPKFREAVAWQNPRALRTAVDALHQALSGQRPANRNVDYRRWEHTVVSYLQRYCAKNDTIGFFGPVGWARVTEHAAEPLTAKPGAGLLAARTTYLENWAVQELAETLTTDAVRPWAVPRLLPFVAVVGTRLHVPLTEPIPIEEAEAAVLAACDGVRSARELAAALVDVGTVPDAATVYAILERYHNQRRIAWTMEVPPAALVPEDSLRAQIAAIGDPAVREPAAAALAEVERGRDAVAAAVGDPDALVTAISGLQERFTELTGAEATRRPGVFYAGRTVVHEECRRDLEVTVSPALLDTLWPPLSVVLEAARWYTAAGAALYRRALHDIYRERAAATGQDALRLADFWLWANDTIFRLDHRVIERLVRTLQERWAAALGGDLGVHRVAEVRDRVLRAFATARPGWPAAVQHSPDLMIAARDADAIRAGDFQWVLGEMHPGLNSMRSALFVSQHPSPADLHAAMAADLGGPRVVLATTRAESGTPQRLADALVSPQDIVIQFGHDACGPRNANTVPVGACEVVERGGRLVARTRDGRRELEIVELLSEQIMAQLVQNFRLLPAGEHTPRVTLDRLVVARETWRLSTGQCRFAFAADEPERFLAAQAWRREHGICRFVFAKSPVEHKPFYVDLESQPSVELFAHAVRVLERELPEGRMSVSEMLPGPEELWLTDAAGARYTAEFRVVAVDRRGRQETAMGEQRGGPREGGAR